MIVKCSVQTKECREWKTRDSGVGGVRGRRGAESQESHMWLLQSNGGNNHLLFSINRAINMETVNILKNMT